MMLVLFFQRKSPLCMLESEISPRQIFGNDWLAHTLLRDESICYAFQAKSGSYICRCIQHETADFLLLLLPRTLSFINAVKHSTRVFTLQQFYTLVPAQIRTTRSPEHRSTEINSNAENCLIQMVSLHNCWSIKISQGYKL